MADGLCLSLFDLYEPQQTKVTQVLVDLEQNTLKLDKFDDGNSGGDDSDYSNEEKAPNKK